jgi:hypothetical protein
MGSVINCPFCGEATELDIGGDAEYSAPGEHVFVQDCDVCCAPIAVRLRIGVDGDFEVSYDRG